LFPLIVFRRSSSITKCTRQVSGYSKLDMPNKNRTIRLPKRQTPIRPIEQLIKPMNIKQQKLGRTASISNFDETDQLKKEDVSAILDTFCRQSMVREEAKKKGISDKFFMSIYNSFRMQCLDVTNLKPELRVLFSDIKKYNHSVDLLFQYFFAHAQSLYPHLDSLDDMKLISDLTQPHNWYPEARSIHRKIVFHAGPTNSGKTYSALKKFKAADTGVYCGPLRLLASEIFKRTNAEGIPCDLATGEDRQFAVSNMEPAKHLSSTVEMLSLDLRTDVAIIDEIQMLRDDQRGWAWTRALLGVAAEEVHLCGEYAAIDICRKLLDPIGEHLQVKTYERKTPYTISTHALGSLRNIDDGDCVVCFSRNDLIYVAKQLEKLHVPCAIVYGALPPETKLNQAAKFNDPNDRVNVLVATDAIGMGLNLNIKRMIFNSITRSPDNQLIQNFHALQIAGRAGRFGSAYEEGVVTTMRHEDLGVLTDILHQPVEEIKEAGISPTYEQLEMFSNYIPNASFVDLLDIFVQFCSTSDEFFLCSIEQIRGLALAIDSYELPLKVRYTFCTVPVKPEWKRCITWFRKMAKRYSTGQPLTEDWFSQAISWPPEAPTVPAGIMILEETFDMLNAYLWLGYRYPEMFPDMEAVKRMSKEVTNLINDAVLLIARIDQKEVSTNPSKSVVCN